jgi:hypothetical protein
MKKIEKSESVANNELPIATIVINEYKNINNRLNETNENLQKSNKRITIMALILLVLFAIETTYIILYWEAMHPESGVIQEKSDK